jgi:hypothetical protein
MLCTTTSWLKATLLATALSSGMAMAEMGTITGKINGHTCAHSGHTCPISSLDPHLQLEAAFVLQQKDGSYFFLSNLPRVTAARYALKMATVKGTINKKTKSIMVDQLLINGKVIWSQAMADKAREEWEALLGSDV